MPNRMTSKEGATQKKKNFVDRIVGWSKKNLREFPWRSTNSPYKVFIAETLLKRTTSTAAERVYQDFLSKFPSLRALAESDRKSIKEALEPIGLYKQRSKGLKEAAEYILEQFNGQFPDSYEQLLEVPYIGPYTAGAILSFAYGRPAPVVDSNVRRVLRRCFREELGDDPSNKKVRSFLTPLVPKKSHRDLNLGLVDLGTLVCSYNEKLCKKCPLKEMCSSSE